jgi:beta-glucosidase
LNYDTPPSEAGSQPLYEFGYGLGYGRVDYRKLTAEVDASAGTVSVTVQLTLAADAELAADEVVQVFASYPPAPVLTPARKLVAFERVRLEPGETREVTLLIPLERLQLWAGDAFGSGEERLFPGRYQLEAGGITAVFELEDY